MHEPPMDLVKVSKCGSLGELFDGMFGLFTIASTEVTACGPLWSTKVQGFAESLQQSLKTEDRSLFGRSSRVVGI